MTPASGWIISRLHDRSASGDVVIFLRKMADFLDRVRLEKGDEVLNSHSEYQIARWKVPQRDADDHWFRWPDSLWSKLVE